MQRWLDVIYEFQYQCTQKDKQYEESEFIKEMKDRVKQEIYEQQNEEREKKKKEGKKEEEDEIEKKNRQIIAGLMKEVKVQRYFVEKVIQSRDKGVAGEVGNDQRLHS